MSAIIETLYVRWWAKIGSGITNPTQVEEMRRAFYSGVAAFFYHQLLVIAALSDDDAENQMQAVENEIKEYFASLGQTYDPLTGMN